MTDVETSDAREGLLAVMEMLRPAMNADDFNAAVLYMDQGELNVTFEHLCEQIYANNTPISQGIYKSLEYIGEVLGYSDHSHWTELKPLVVA